MRIGFDLDNTLARYDAVFLRHAQALGLAATGKAEMSVLLRQLPDGEVRWQRLQGSVYGQDMAAADHYPGLSPFLERLRRENATLFIVSHRTERPHFDPDGVHLHDAARAWLADQGWLGGWPWAPERVFFESTRSAKLARIAALDLDVFIDDLPEVLNDAAFPVGVKAVLFDPLTAWDGVAKQVLP